MYVTRVFPASALLSLALAAPLWSGVKSAPLFEAERSLSSLPAWFEPNLGQDQPEVRFLSRGGSGSLQIRNGSVRFLAGGKSVALRMLGSNRGARLEGRQPRLARSTYMVGDRRRWIHDLPQYGRVRARQVYPGIDVDYYLSGSEVEYDFLVAPHADPSRIRLSFSEAGAARIEPGGDLAFANGLRQKKPVAYQEIAGRRAPVEVSYWIDRPGEVRFRLGAYDRSKPLVIDPVLHAGYFGADRTERATAAAVDSQGNLWVAGSSAARKDGNLPEANQPFPISGGGRDIFLAQFGADPAGRLVLVYWTQLGGSQDDEALAMTTDSLGFVYLAGSTASTDFLRAGSPIADAHGGGVDAFVLKVRPSDGPAALWYSQWFGGAGTDVAYGVAVDGNSSIYIAGSSNSDKLPGIDGNLQASNRGGTEGFVVKINPDAASPRAYASFLGGTSTDVITALAVDGSGNLFLTGYTSSDDFPVTGDASQGALRSNLDSFLVQMDVRRSGLDALLYGTFLGGDGLDQARAIFLEENGGIWIGGYTDSTSFLATPNAYRTVRAGAVDLFALRFDFNRRSSPDAVTYATYVGGNLDDVMYGMAVLPDGRVALTGYTLSDDFPRVNEVGPAQPSKGPDACIAVVDPAVAGQAGLTYATVLSGDLGDVGMSVAADRLGRLFIAGHTLSVDLPVTDGSRKLAPGGATQSFVWSVSPPR